MEVFRGNETLLSDEYLHCGLFLFRMKNEIKQIIRSDDHGGVEVSTKVEVENCVYLFDLPTLQSKDVLFRWTHIALAQTERFMVLDTTHFLAENISKYLLGNFQFDIETSVLSRKPRIVIAVDVSVMRTVVDETKEGTSCVINVPCSIRGVCDEEKPPPPIDHESEGEQELEDLLDYAYEDEKEVEDPDHVEEDEDKGSVMMDVDSGTNQGDESNLITVLLTLLSFLEKSPEFLHPETTVPRLFYGLELVEAATKFFFIGFDVARSVDPCPICLEEFLVGTAVGKTPCSHVFHRDCLLNWLSSNNSCPLCRSVCGILV
ncbi:unnamed protein product [Ilex paraguariensis]|uniref:RING-type domain-containing protein n=1 Tax=Ilex paraguariensis TaxID=185542 RepID=A0ABC8THF8_9AQUA